PLLPGHEAQPLDEFTILTADSVSGMFDEVTGDGIFSVIYSAASVTLVYEGPLPQCPNPADLNCSGAVDVQDMLIMLSAWGPCPPEGECAEDLNDSGAVDVQDLLILLGNWG